MFPEVFTPRLVNLLSPTAHSTYRLTPSIRMPTHELGARKNPGNGNRLVAEPRGTGGIFSPPRTPSVASRPPTVFLPTGSCPSVVGSCSFSCSAGSYSKERCPTGSVAAGSCPTASPPASTLLPPALSLTDPEAIDDCGRALRTRRKRDRRRERADQKQETWYFTAYL